LARKREERTELLLGGEVHVRSTSGSPLKLDLRIGLKRERRKKGKEFFMEGHRFSFFQGREPGPRVFQRNLVRRKKKRI